MNPTTNTITHTHPAAHWVLVVDAEGKIVHKVISYNVDTKECTKYVIDDDGFLVKDFNTGCFKRETVVLEGSKIVFVEPLPTIGTTSKFDGEGQC